MMMSDKKFLEKFNGPEDAEQINNLATINKQRLRLLLAIKEFPKLKNFSFEAVSKRKDKDGKEIKQKMVFDEHFEQNEYFSYKSYLEVALKALKKENTLAHFEKKSNQISPDLLKLPYDRLEKIINNFDNSMGKRFLYEKNLDGIPVSNTDIAKILKNFPTFFEWIDAKDFAKLFKNEFAKKFLLEGKIVINDTRISEKISPQQKQIWEKVLGEHKIAETISEQQENEMIVSLVGLIDEIKVIDKDMKNDILAYKKFAYLLTKVEQNNIQQKVSPTIPLIDAKDFSAKPNVGPLTDGSGLQQPKATPKPELVTLSPKKIDSVGGEIVIPKNTTIDIPEVKKTEKDIDNKSAVLKTDTEELKILHAMKDETETLNMALLNEYKSLPELIKTNISYIASNVNENVGKIDEVTSSLDAKRQQLDSVKKSISEHITTLRKTAIENALDITDVKETKTFFLYLDKLFGTDSALKKVFDKTFTDKLPTLIAKIGKFSSTDAYFLQLARKYFFGKTDTLIDGIIGNQTNQMISLLQKKKEGDKRTEKEIFAEIETVVVVQPTLVVNMNKEVSQNKVIESHADGQLRWKTHVKKDGSLIDHRKVLYSDQSLGLSFDKTLNEFSLEESKLLFTKIFGNGPATEVIKNLAEDSKDMYLRIVALAWHEGTFNFMAQNNDASGKGINGGCFQLLDGPHVPFIKDGKYNPDHYYFRALKVAQDKYPETKNIALSSSQSDLLAWIGHLHLRTSVGKLFNFDSKISGLRDSRIGLEAFKKLIVNDIQGSRDILGPNVWNTLNNKLDQFFVINTGKTNGEKNNVSEKLSDAPSGNLNLDRIQAGKLTEIAVVGDSTAQSFKKGTLNSNGIQSQSLGGIAVNNINGSHKSVIIAAGYNEVWKKEVSENDKFDEKNNTEIRGIRPLIDGIISKITGKQPILTLIPEYPSGATSTYKGKTIDLTKNNPNVKKYNAIIYSIAQEKGLPLLDLRQYAAESYGRADNMGHMSKEGILAVERALADALKNKVVASGKE